ncbi:MAG TPA: sigma 54-interacting transcriptional regulator, partial [Clostridia bacterium]|nr:sigma 54-interacting transcriptional regulator [Clostridia bacterium]
HTMGALIAIKRLIEVKLDSSSKYELELPGIINKELMEIIEDGVVVVDNDSKILAVNRNASDSILDGWNSVIGFTTGTVWGENDPFWEVLRMKKPITNKSFVYKSINSNSIFNCNISPIIGINGKCLGAIGIFKDKHISENNIKGVNNVARAYYNFDSIVGNSDSIKWAIKLARETASRDNNVLILGETGTGKELFAQAIHNASPFSAGPFLAVNCSAIPNQLLESELFGYEGGSFTGAKKTGSPGKFEMAKGGTIFLDEINSMSSDMQAKILRVLQNKTVVRIGGDKEISVNIRIIAASNTDLWGLVQQNQFREDLYYRINVISIIIPPIRKRGNDIDLLIDNIIDRMSARLGEIISIEEGARLVLRSHSWPGNVRELENVLEKGWVIARTNNSDVITHRELQELKGREERVQIVTDDYSEKNNHIKNTIKQTNDLENVECQTIIAALRANNGNIQVTSHQLGIARNTMYRKLKKYNIKI